MYAKYNNNDWKKNISIEKNTSRNYCFTFVYQLEQNSQKNDTEDLENRVYVLEFEMDIVQGDVTILYDDVEELQNQDALTDLRLTTVEENVAIHQLDIEGTFHQLNGYS